MCNAAAMAADPPTGPTPDLAKASPAAAGGGLMWDVEARAFRPGALLLAMTWRGVGVDELAVESGLSRATVYSAIRGRHIRPRSVIALTQALGRHPVRKEIAEVIARAA